MTATTLATPTDLDQQIAELDLTEIEERLARKLAWSADRTANAIAEYRQFLHLIKNEGMHSGQRPLSPDMDEVWHAHILHTRKYMKDCNEIFGQFLHHQPLPKRRKAEEEADCTCCEDCAVCECV